ncbi:hypothetical protein Nepgr_023465 [Nepenthes gracilis]|uniref:RING-type E3 ubiquitin transferase n=1 Tax=Nepenthes gracilis TaxID=150966 RepID=A0AAD3T238_NEPGR|nr:hypothetical protein Nepgr_023465 [Nepenthes gracilis]
METVGAPQPWASAASSAPNNFNDCSRGICTIYCRQWCYYSLLPPPPPFSFPDYDAGGSGGGVSPLMVAAISLLASAFLLLSYYTVVSKYCRRWRSSGRSRDRVQFQSAEEDLEARLDQLVREPTNSQRVSSTGVDARFIKSITVFNYRRGDGLIEGTDCAVCLSEFKEEERLRLMPNCQHAFHVPCIDAWLKSNSSCPLCRSSMIDRPPLPVVREGSGTRTNPANVSALRVENGSDVAVLADNPEMISNRHEMPNSHGGGGSGSSNEDDRDGVGKEGTQRCSSSISMAERGDSGIKFN